MKKFSKINESKLDTIKDILIELDLIDGVKSYSEIISTDESGDRSITVRVDFETPEKYKGSYIINSEKINTLIEVFETIKRLNKAGYKSYIKYLVTNSTEMIFKIEL